MRRTTLLAAWGACALLCARASAQEIPRPDYLTYLPAEEALPVGAQPATGAFHLYGDTAATGYVDQDPRNGIDDARDRWLTALAVRFAPWMVRNTVDFPMDWRRFVYQGASFPLFLDVFDQSGEHPRLIRSESIDLQNIERTPCPFSGEAAARDTTPDCRLLALLQRLAPDRRAAPRATAPGDVEAEVMFFDMPGSGPKTWSEEFEGAAKGTISRRYLGWAKTFVHPLVAPVAGHPESDPRFDLMLQYWFFYPYNDAGNIHEGDWEHINVLLTTRAQGARRFTREELQALLADEGKVLAHEAAFRGLVARDEALHGGEHVVLSVLGSGGSHGSILSIRF